MHARGAARPRARPRPRRPAVVRVGVARHHRSSTVEPLYRDTLDFDRHRLGEIEAQIAGVPYETDDPNWAIGQAMEAAAGSDPDVLRGFVDIASLLARPDEVLHRPGLLDTVLAAGRDPGRAAARTEPHRAGRPRPLGLIRPSLHDPRPTTPRTSGAHRMRIETDGVGLDVTVEGEGPPVVLLHGWPDTHELWDHQAKALVAAGYQVIAPDLRGFGASDKPEGARRVQHPAAGRRRARHPRPPRPREGPRGRPRLGRRAGLGHRRVHARPGRPPGLPVGRTPGVVRRRRVRAAPAQLVHAPVPVRGHRRAVALDGRLHEHAGVVPPSAARRDQGAAQRAGGPDRLAELVPGQRAPRRRSCSRPSRSRRWRRRRWASGARRTSR